MVIMSAIFSYVSVTLLRRFQITDFTYRILILLFALYPANPVMGFTATKDVLFAGFFILSAVLLLQLLYTETPHKKCLWAAFVAAAVLMMLFRNNAPYAFAIFFLLALILFKNRALAARLLLPPLVLAVVLSNLLIVSFNAARPRLGEALSVPLQQIAAAVNYNADEIEPSELQTIYEILTPEGIQNYNPTFADSVKGTFDAETFRSDPMKYVVLYFRLGVKCPVTYLNAFLNLTMPYWYPYGTQPVAPYGRLALKFLVFDNHINYQYRVPQLNLFPRIRSWLEGMFRWNGFEQYPGVAYLFNMGFLTWLFVGAFAYFVYIKDRVYIPFVLAICLLFTLLFGPIALVRYYYPFMLCVPVLLALLFRRRETQSQSLGKSFKILQNPFKKFFKISP